MKDVKLYRMLHFMVKFFVVIIYIFTIAVRILRMRGDILGSLYLNLIAMRCPLTSLQLFSKPLCYPNINILKST